MTSSLDIITVTTSKPTESGYSTMAMMPCRLKMTMRWTGLIGLQAMNKMSWKTERESVLTTGFGVRTVNAQQNKKKQTKKRRLVKRKILPEQ